MGFGKVARIVNAGCLGEHLRDVYLSPLVGYAFVDEGDVLRQLRHRAVHLVRARDGSLEHRASIRDFPCQLQPLGVELFALHSRAEVNA